MANFQKLTPFPLGAIKAEGFLKDQLIRGKSGMAGKLLELEPEMIADPYVKDTFIKVWRKDEQIGWQAEISGNYWVGYIQHAFTLNDEEMINRATKWVNDVLKTQREDGYLGTYRKKGAFMHDDYNAWGSSCLYRALLPFYEATKRQDVFDAVYRSLLWFCENWAGDKKTVYGGPAILEPMVYVYQKTSDERLLKFIKDYMEFLPTNDVFNLSYKSMLEKDLEYFSNHSGSVVQAVRIPALAYSVTGEEKYLNASTKRIDDTLKKAIHPTGGTSCVAEFLAPVASTTEYEYCSFTFALESYNCMSYITGDPKYGDLIENVFYNAAQGARKKDEKAIAYLTAPNQIYATEWSSPSYSDVQVYAPCYTTACCPVNAVVIVPEFVRSLMHRDDENNVYVMGYGPSSLSYEGIEISQETLYPFRNKVTFRINSDKEFKLNLKIPAWAKGYTITINEKAVSGEVISGFVCLDNSWKKGDIIKISFDAEVEVFEVDDSDYAAKYPLAIRYGALLYSYHIPEEWQEIEGNPLTKLPEDWHWYNVVAKYDEPDVPEYHERLGHRYKQFTWNIVVDKNLAASDIEIEELPENGYVWENPPIRLHTHCYKAPLMNAPYQMLTHEPFGKFQKVSEKLPLTLEPYGCTNLRLTYFHKADLDTK